MIRYIDQMTLLFAVGTVTATKNNLMEIENNRKSKFFHMLNKRETVTFSTCSQTGTFPIESQIDDV